MKLLCSGAAAAIAVATIVLAGCAADQPQKPEQQAQANSCIGVDPPTGSLLRRKEDCGASRNDGHLPQDVIDDIRRAQMNNVARPPSMGGGGR